MTVALHRPDIICVDYGHGGILDGIYQTSNKHYTFTDYKLRVNEGELNRQLAAKLMNYLLNLGFNTYDVVANTMYFQHLVGNYLDASDLCQQDTSLQARVRNASKYPQAPLVSIHHNAIAASASGPSQKATGFIVFTSVGDTRSDGLATQIVEHVDRYTNRRVRRQMHDGDPDYERDFYMLRKTHNPAVLIEAGFYDNYQELQVLADESHQMALAQSIAVSIQEWMVDQ